MSHCASSRVQLLHKRSHTLSTFISVDFYKLAGVQVTDGAERVLPAEYFALLCACLSNLLLCKDFVLYEAQHVIYG